MKDCTQLALNRLSLSDLADEAQKSRECFRNAGDIFGRRFSGKSISIEGISPNFTEKLIIESGDIIKIRSFEMMSKVLKSFCHKIRTLQIDYKRINPDQRYDVGVSVNELCSNYLIEFSVINVQANELNGMQQPFKKVENLLLVGWFEKLSSDNLTLVQLFPMLRVLELNLAGVYDANSINCTIPHLNRFEISQYPLRSMNLLSVRDVNNFLKINPQIQELLLQHPSAQNLKVVRDYSPNVKQLTLELSYIQDYSASSINRENIRFKHIDILNVIAISNQALKFISFDQLEKFELYCFSDDMSEWIDFITMNIKNLQKLYLSRGTLNLAHTINLTGHLTNLIELYVTFDLDVDSETIIKLVNESKKLQTIHLQVSNDIYDDLMRNLEENHWTKSKQTIGMDTLLSSWMSLDR